MSADIDERIVSMKFDNEQFEKGIDKTSKSLEKFKKDMDFDKEEKKFRNFEKSLNNSNLDGLATAADRVSIKFNAMAAAGYAAIQHIVDKAMNSTEALVKSLSVDQIASGWSKYAEKTASVQTIMAATGADIETVNNQLKKLLWFADETSYSFTDMTNGIGKFTAAGQDLNKSVKAMQGISTWAAISGQKSEAASRAIFNIAQAISTGYMGVADWKSIELANMATKDFKQNVIETAADLGKLTTKVDEYGKTLYYMANGEQVTAEGMRETLKNKWFDSAVMVEVLNKYGSYADRLGQVYSALGEEVPTSKIIPDIERMNNGQKTSIKYTGKALAIMEDLKDEWDSVGAKAFAAAQMAKTYEDAIEATKDATSTAWMNVFEEIFGNFNEAKVYWTNFANDLWDVFVPRVIDIKDLMNEAFGRDTTMFDEILDKTKLGSSEILSNLKVLALQSGEISVETADAAESIADLSKDGAISIETFAKAFKTLKTDILSYTKLKDGSLSYGKDEVKRTKEQIKSIDSVTKHIKLNKEAYENLMEAYATKTGREYLFDTIHNVLASISALSDKIAEGWARVFPMSGGKIYDILVKMATATENFLNKLDEEAVTSKLQSIGSGIASVFKLFGNVVKTVWNGAKRIAAAFGITSDSIFGFADKLGKFLSGLEYSTREMSVLKSVFEAIASVISALVRPVKEFFGYLNSEFEKAIYEGAEAHPIIINLAKTAKGLGDAFRLVALIITKVLDAFSELTGSAKPTTSVIGSIAEAIFTVTGKIGEFISWVYEGVKNTTILKTVFGYLGVAINYVITVLSGFGEIFVNVFRKIIDKIPKLGIFSDKAENAANSLEEFKKAVSNSLLIFKKWKNEILSKPIKIFDAIAKVFGKIGNFFKTAFGKIVEWLAPVVKYIAEQFQPIWNNFKEWITNLNFETFKDFTKWLQTMFNGGLLSGILITVNKIFKTVNKKMKDVGTWRDIISKFLNALTKDLGKALNGLANKLNAEALHEVAESLLMLVGAMAALTLLPLDKVTVAGGILVGIVNALASAMHIMSSATGGPQSSGVLKFGKFYLALKSPLEGFTAMGQAVKINAIKQVAIATAIIAGAIAGLAIVIKKFDISENTVTVIGGILVGAMMAIAGIMAIIDRLIDKRTTAIDNSVKISTNLNALKKGLSKIGDACKKIAAGVQFKLIASSLLTIVGAIALMALVVKHLGPYIWEGIWALSLIFAELALVYKLISKDGEQAVFAAGAIKLITKTLTRVVFAIGILAGITKLTGIGALVASVVGIGAVFAELALVLTIVSKTGNAGVTASLALKTLSSVIFTISVSMSLLTAVTNGREKAAMTAALSIGALFIVLSASITIISETAKNAFLASKSLSVLSGVIMSIGVVLSVLTAVANQDGGEKALMTSALSIGALFFVLSEVLKNMSSVKNAESTVKALNKLTGALLGISAALGLISIIGADKALAAVAVLSLALGGIVVFSKTIAPLIGVLTAVSNAFNIFGRGVLYVGAGLALSALSIMMFSGAIKMMGSITEETADKAGNAMMAFCETIIQRMPNVLQAVGVLISGFFKMLASIMPSIGEFVTSLIGMIVKALYDNINNIAKTFVQLIIDVLMLVKDNIQQVVELVLDIVINIIRGVTEKVDDIVVEVVKLFMAIIRGFAEALKQIDFAVFDEALAAIGTLAAIIALLATVSATAPLAIIGIGFMAVLLLEMNALVPGLTTLSNELQKGNFNGTIVKSMAVAVAMLGVAANTLPRYGGLMAGFLGQKVSLKDFAKDLSDAAPHLAKLSNILSNNKFKPILITNAATAIKALGEAARALPRYGGLAAGFGGQLVNLTAFAKDIKPLAKRVLKLSQQFGSADFKVKPIKKIGIAIKALAEAAWAMPRYGGLQSVVNGQMENLTEFSDEILKISKKLFKISEAYGNKDFDKDRITNIADCVVALAEAANKMPRYGGLQSVVNGQMESLYHFSNDVIIMAARLLKISQGYTKHEYNPEMIQHVVNGISALIDAANKMPKTGGIESWWSGDRTVDTLTSIADAMVKVAPNLVKFSEDLNKGTFKKSIVQKGASAITLLAEAASVLPKYGGLQQLNDGFMAKLEEFAPGVAAIAPSLVTFCEELNKGTFKRSLIEKGATAIKILAEAASVLPTYGGLEDLKEGMMPSLGLFAIDAAVAAPHIVAFAKALGKGNFGKRGERISNASDAIVALAKAANELPKYGGFVSLGEGFMSTLTLFVIDALAMAPHLIELSGKLKSSDFDPELIKSTGIGIKALAEAASALPKFGGANALIEGQQESLKDFAVDMAEMAPYLVHFANELGRGNFRSSIVEEGATAVKMIAEAANAIGQYSVWDNVLSVINEKTLQTFAGSLVDLAPKLVEFSEEIGKGSFNVNNVENAANGIKFLAEAADALPDDKNVFTDWAVHKTSLADFAETLPDIAKQLVAFSGICLGIKDDGFKNGISGLKQFTKMAKSISEMGSEVNVHLTTLLTSTDVTGGPVDLGKFSDYILTFVKNWGKIAEQLNSTSLADAEKLNACIEALTKFTEFGKAISTFDIYAMGNFNDAMNSMGTDGINTFIATFNEDAYNRAKAAGAKLFINVLSGLDSERDSITTKVETLVNVLVGNFKSATNLQAIQSIGAYYSQGLLDGMKENESEVIDYVNELAAAMKTTLQTELDIHSPSRFGKWIGRMWDKGLADGIKEKMADPINANKTMADLLLEEYLNDITDGSVKVEDLLTTEATGVIKKVAKGIELDGETYVKDAMLQVADDSVAELTAEKQQRRFKQVGSEYMQRIADGSVENGYVVDEAFTAELDAVAAKCKAKMATEGGKTTAAYFQGMAQYVGTHGMPTSVVGEWQNAVKDGITNGDYSDAGTDFLKNFFGGWGWDTTDWSDLIPSGGILNNDADEAGKKDSETYTDSVSSGLSGGSSKISNAVEKKVIPALDFTKSKKFRKTIKNAGKELKKAYADSVKVFGDKRLKMTGEELEKLSKRLAKYYNNSSKTLQSDRDQMKIVLAHIDYLEKKKSRLIKQSEKLTKKFQEESEAAVAAGDAKKVMELQEKYDKDMKLQDKKTKRTKKELKVSKELRQSYIDSATALGKTAYYTDNLKKGTYKYATIFKDAKKDITSSMNLKGSAKKVVNSYIDSLYRETDAYTSDSEAVESATKNFNDASDKLNKLYATREKFTNGKKKLTKEELKNLLAEIAQAEEEFREAGQELDDARKEMYNNILASFDEVWEPVRQNIEDGFDILKRSFETGIDLINTSVENSKVNIDFNSVFSTGASKKTNIIDVLTASAETGIDIFSKFNDSATESTRSLLRNMKSQIEGFDNIATGLQSLKNRGVSDDMVEYIKSMGTQAASYIKVFGRMSSEQIAEANKWFAESKKRSAETLISNMRETFEAKSKYDSNIQSLIARGLNADIINAIKEKGIEDQQMLKDYMNLTDEQIREANSWYEKSKSLEIEAKTKNVQDQLDEEITALEKWNADIEQVMSDGKVSEAWIEKIKEAGPKSRDILDAFMTMTEDQIVKMNNRLADINAKDATNAADALIQAQEAKLADYASYQEKIATLLSRTGIGEAMRKSLSTLTINDMDKINAYLSMSDDQILKSNEMFEKEADYTRDALIKTHNETIQDTKDWVNDILDLGETMGPEILQEMMNMGMDSSSAYIDAFKRMTPEQQKEISDAYANKTEMSTNTMAALVLMIADKGKTIGEAYKEAAAKGAEGTGDAILDTVTGEVDGTTDAGSDAASGVADGIDSQTKTIKAAGKKAGKAMVNGIKESKDKMVQAMSDNIIAMVDKAKSFNDEFNKRGRVIGKKIQSGLESKTESMVETINLVADSVIEAFKAKNEAFKLAGSDAGKSVTTGLEEAMASIYDKAVSSGNDLIQGLINGVNDKSYTSQLNKAMKSVMGNALQAARDEAGIHSPSRVADEMGKFIDLGLAQGITSYASKVIESAEELSDVTFTGLSSAMKNLANTVSEEMDTTPVIRPVMDLSGVHDGISALNGELQNNYNIGGLYGRASGLAGGINAARANKMSTADALQNLQASLGDNAGVNNVTYDNTFNITGDNPREIANQVSKILQQQVERRGAVWA